MMARVEKGGGHNWKLEMGGGGDWWDCGMDLTLNWKWIDLWTMDSKVWGKKESQCSSGLTVGTRYYHSRHSKLLTDDTAELAWTNKLMITARRLFQAFKPQGRYQYPLYHTCKYPRGSCV